MRLTYQGTSLTNAVKLQRAQARQRGREAPAAPAAAPAAAPPPAAADTSRGDVGLLLQQRPPNRMAMIG